MAYKEHYKKLAYARAYRQREEYKVKQYEKRYRQKLKKDVLEKYGGEPSKCACCGETNIKFLTIDHINNDGAQHRKVLNGMQFYVLLRQSIYEPQRYQVLCYNCNCGRKDNGGICPHKII